jgi:hypothetical protein
MSVDTAGDASGSALASGGLLRTAGHAVDAWCYERTSKQAAQSRRGARKTRASFTAAYRGQESTLCPPFRPATTQPARVRLAHI